jgi:hypothetical protein
VLALIDELEARVHALEQRDQARHRDLAADARLLSALALGFGHSVVTAADVARSSSSEVRGVIGAAPVRTAAHLA